MMRTTTTTSSLIRRLVLVTALIGVSLAGFAAPVAASGEATGASEKQYTDTSADERPVHVEPGSVDDVWFVPESKKYGFLWTHPSVDWGYATATLVIRFVGIFVLLLFVQVGINISSAVIRRYETRRAGGAATKSIETAPAAPALTEEGDVPGEIVAAIAVALESESSVGALPDSVLAGGPPSRWSTIGKAAAMSTRVVVGRPAHSSPDKPTS